MIFKNLKVFNISDFVLFLDIDLKDYMTIISNKSPIFSLWVLLV